MRSELYHCNISDFSGSIRHLLRLATATDHAEVDSRFAMLIGRGVAGYAEFLQLCSRNRATRTGTARGQCRTHASGLGRSFTRPISPRGPRRPRTWHPTRSTASTSMPWSCSAGVPQLCEADQMLRPPERRRHRCPGDCFSAEYRELFQKNRETIEDERQSPRGISDLDKANNREKTGRRLFWKQGRTIAT
jgi:hypothetical protein